MERRAKSWAGEIYEDILEFAIRAGVFDPFEHGYEPGVIEGPVPRRSPL